MDLRERKNVDYKEKSLSPETEKSVEYNPREKFDPFHPPVNLSSPSSTSGSTVSNVSVGCAPTSEHVCSTIGYHNYSKKLPSTSRSKVAKCKSNNCVSSDHKLISGSLVGEKADDVSKVAPIPSQVPQLRHTEKTFSRDKSQSRYNNLSE